MQKSVLIADLPEPAEFIRQSVQELFDSSFCVHAFDDAITLLSQHEFALIICGLHFDECRMMELLWRVKEMPAYQDVPFLCVRALDAHHETTESVRAVHAALGAAGFIEFPRMDAAATEKLREEVASLGIG